MGWWANQRKRRMNNLTQDVKTAVVHHLRVLIPVKVGLRVERLPGIPRLNCTTRQS